MKVSNIDRLLQKPDMPGLFSIRVFVPLKYWERSNPIATFDQAPESAVLDARKELLGHSLKELNGVQRQVLMLQLAGKPFPEIARKIGETETTAELIYKMTIWELRTNMGVSENQPT
jgi:hypothetical protein